MLRTPVLLILACSLAACGQAATESDDPQPVPTSPQPVTPSPSPSVTATSPAAFAQCKTCHAVEPGRAMIGPSLVGIHGKPAASAQGYAYSAALKSSGLTWDDATLDRYLEAPMQTVPGTKMVYPGVKDAAKRAEIVAYLKTI